MRRIMVIVLMLNVFFLSGESLSELPIDKWPRDRRIDKQVKRLAKKIEFHCKLVKGDYGAFGWDIVGVKLLYKLGEIVRNNPQKGIPSVYDIAMDRGRDRLLRGLMWEGLLDLEEEACVKAACKFILDKSEDEILRARVIELLGGTKDTSATPYLIQVMEDKSNPERVRWCAARAFIPIRDRRAIPCLLELVQSEENDDIRAIAAGALGSNAYAFKDTNITRFIIRELEEEDNWKVRMMEIECLGCLGRVGDKRATRVLLELARKKKDLFHVIKELGNIGTPECKEALLQLLKDEDESIRFFAAKAIIKTGDKGAISEVERSLERFSSGHREVIGKALKEAKKE